jgi:hypothetical protein
VPEQLAELEVLTVLQGAREAMVKGPPEGKARARRSTTLAAAAAAAAATLVVVVVPPPMRELEEGEEAVISAAVAD